MNPLSNRYARTLMVPRRSSLTIAAHASQRPSDILEGATVH
jgi:hypothetical protein